MVHRLSRSAAFSIIIDDCVRRTVYIKWSEMYYNRRKSLYWLFIIAQQHNTNKLISHEIHILVSNNLFYSLIITEFVNDEVERWSWTISRYPTVSLQLCISICLNMSAITFFVFLLARTRGTRPCSTILYPPDRRPTMRVSSSGNCLHLWTYIALHHIQCQYGYKKHCIYTQDISKVLLQREIFIVIIQDKFTLKRVFWLTLYIAFWAENMVVKTWYYDEARWERNTEWYRDL
jgi:hypothetical protein